jgi:cytochrome b pre-mRNA-processing protein 3
MLNAFRKSAGRRKHAESLLAALMERARGAEFFGALGVADTIDGRFDLVTLHAWLVLKRLEAQGARDLAQDVTDRLFVGFDEALRDLGVGDLGIGPRMKKFANAFYGRMQAYDAASSESGLADAILRNVYRGDPAYAERAAQLAAYAWAARERLEGVDLLKEPPDFGMPLS